MELHASPESDNRPVPEASGPATSSTEGPSDGQLIDRYRRGDLGAFTQLYQRYGYFVFDTVRRVLRNPALADSAAQDTWLRVLGSAGASFDRNRPFKPYLAMIAVHVARDHLHRSPVVPSDWLDELAAETGKPEAPMSMLDICGCILQLPPDDARFLLLYLILRASHAEVADLLKIDKPNTCAQRLSRIRARLWRLVAGVLREREARGSG